MGVGIVRVIHLVAYAPGENGDMVSVTPHHIGEILLSPLFKEVVGALKAGCTDVPSFEPLPFRELPLIKRFVHHEQSQLITERIEIRVLRVVACADGIAANLLQVEQPSFPHILVYRCTEDTAIVMQTDTFHFHPLTVQGKSLVGVKRIGSETGHRL